MSDAGWSTFRRRLEYFGFKYGKATVTFVPHCTSHNRSNCGKTLKKALSVRTHVCPDFGYVAGGYVANGDGNAAITPFPLKDSLDEKAGEAGEAGEEGNT